MGKKKKRTEKSAWKVLFTHIKDYKRTILWLGALGIVSALANGMVPYLVGQFLDALIDLSQTTTIFSQTIPLWVALLLLWGVVQLVANIADWQSDKRGQMLQSEIQLGYLSKGFEHLLFAPLSYFKDEKIGEVSEVISRAGWQISSITNNILIRLTPPLLSVVVGIIVVSAISPVFTGIMLLGIAIYIFILIRLVTPKTGLFDKADVFWWRSYGDAVQTVSNIQSVKHMTAEKYEQKKIHQSFAEKTTGMMKTLASMWSGINFYQRAIILAVQTIVFIVSVYFIQNGRITVGELVALNSYAGLLLGPFVLLGHNWQILQAGIAGMKNAEKKSF